MESKLLRGTGLSFLSVILVGHVHAAQQFMVHRLRSAATIVRAVIWAGAAALVSAGLFSGAYALFFARTISQGQIVFLFAGALAIVAMDRRFSGRRMTAPDSCWFRKVMLEVREEERRRIAADLHDTTMQDLFFLKRKLVALLEKYAMSKEDEQQLKSLINFVELINVGLRQNCFELDPYLLQEIGFVSMMTMYLDKERADSSFEIQYSAEGTSAIEQQDLHTQKHLFRVVQELLNNAKKHSQASKVIFTLSESAGWIHLNYVDDGIGFEGKRTIREMGASGKGIEQLKGRILHLNGQVRLETANGRGVRFDIAIPVRRADRAG